MPPDARDDFWRFLLSLTTFGRLAEPAEIAALVAWLLSDESSFANGGVYPIDGGQAAL